MKFKIELNKELQVKHLLTKCEGTEVEDTKLFDSVDCYLNFNDDLLQFEYYVKTFRWQGLSKVTKRIRYEKVNSDTFTKTALELPIVYDESTPDSDFTLVNVEANFKDVLLNLFSPHKKEFKLFINYTTDFLQYQTTFHFLIPDIDQTDWYAGTYLSKTQVYQPQTIGGFDLVKLFRRDFSLSIDDSSQEEATCLSVVLFGPVQCTRLNR